MTVVIVVHVMLHIWLRRHMVRGLFMRNNLDCSVTNASMMIGTCAARLLKDFAKEHAELKTQYKLWTRAEMEI